MTKELQAAAEEFKDKHQVAIQTFPFTVVGAAFIEGAQWAIKHSPEVLKLVAALRNECCCPGESNWTTGEPIMCDPCEALTAYRKSVGEP